MAEKFDPSPETPESEPTKIALRSRARRLVTSRPAAMTPARQTRAQRRAAGKPHPMRSFFTVAAVAGLVATVAVPAAVTAAGTVPAEAAVTTMQQVAADNAQSLVVASEATPAALTRGSYSATTPEEIQAKKDEEAAKAAAAARIAAAASSGGGGSSYAGSLADAIAPAGSVVRPLPYFDHFGEPYAGHKGTDYMVARGTPIYAVADGVVVASDEDGPGWGVYVKIAHNIGGQSVTSLYAHMLYGSRRVTVGETVRAGQLIGQVSDTGRAFGTHLHLEIYVNGSWIYAEDWLAANVR